MPKLSPQDRLYFIHIPKTAGTTLIPFLDARFHADEICPAQLWRELVTLPQEDLPRYRLFRGHFGAGGLKPFLTEPPVSITLLRHPVALSLSTYRFILREPATRVHQLVKSQGMTFSDFLDHPETRKKVNDMQVRHLSFDLRYDPDTGPIFLSSESRAAVDRWVASHEVFPLTAEERLERARKMLLSCAWFGLTERFDESMALLSWSFGWPPAGQVQKLRVAPGGVSSDELPEEVLQKVRDCNQQDLILYNEAERWFEARLTAMLDDLTRYIRTGERMPRSFAEDPAFVHTLLDRHYLQHLAPHPLPESGLRLDLNEPLLGYGWHRRERAPADHSTFRWSGPAAESFIDLPVPAGQDMVLEFRIVHALALDVIDSLQITANGQPLKLEIIEGADSTVRKYSSLIPATAVKGKDLIRLCFRVRQTLSPQSLDPSNPDERQVGIALNWLEVHPYNKAASNG